MALDASIFNALGRGVKSIQDYDNEAQQAQANALGLQTQRLNLLGAQQKQQEYQRGLAEQEGLRNALQGAADDNQRYDRAMGLGTQTGFTYADTLKKAQTARRKEESEANAKDVETENKVIATYRDMIGMAQDPGAAARMLQLMHSDPRMKNTPIARVPLDQALAQIGNDPQSFANFKQQFGLGATKYIEKNAPTLTTQNLGGTSRIVATPGLGGPSTVAAEAPITQSADNAATVGASLANAAALRAQAQATRDAANVQRDQATEMKLADDYRAQSKEFAQAKSAHEQLTATLGSATTSPAATLAAATKFMKILDPGSVVRESELGMALAASGVIDRAMNYVSTMQSGQKLTPTQAADFKKISGQMFQAAQRVQQTIDKDYQAKAKQYGLRPEMVTQDLGQNAKVTSWSELK